MTCGWAMPVSFWRKVITVYLRLLQWWDLTTLIISAVFTGVKCVRHRRRREIDPSIYDKIMLIYINIINAIKINLLYHYSMINT